MESMRGDNMFNQLVCKVEENYYLKEITTMGVGGPCKFYVVPNSIQDIQEVKRKCVQYDTQLLIIGNGSNVVIDDSGFEGVVLHIGKRLKNMKLDQDHLYAEAGVALPNIAFSMAKEGITGFEFMASIPGTVGGGVVMNAGSLGKETSSVLKSVTYLDEEGMLHTKDSAELGLSFRTSRFLGRKDIILSANFSIERSPDKAALMEKTKEVANVRKKKFPMNVATVGSTFKSPFNGPHPGNLIEKVGLKGYQVGGAQISTVHANWVINTGSATAQDVKELIRIMQETVKQELGVWMEQEVIYV